MAITQSKAVSLNQRIEEFLLSRGAIKVGFATVETLDGGPPSVDLSYKLPGAKSAVSFAFPLNKDYIRPFLAKEDRSSHEKDDADAFAYTKALSWECADMLSEEGYPSKGTTANLKYRTEIEGWEKGQYPDISHRYIAVRSGVGSFGWSGNVGIKGFGTTIMLGTIITTAELEATDAIPEGEGFCDKCKICVASCATEMFDKEKSTTVTIGGVDFTYSARRNLSRCFMCCGGATGLHKSGKWSTWSPGRMILPEGDSDEELDPVYRQAIEKQKKRPPMPGGAKSTLKLHSQPDRVLPKVVLTCGNCQLICWGDKVETAKNLKILRQSGCVVQRPDGSIEALPPEEAEAEFNKMDPEHREAYC
ncbi:MAG: epoxyqueuosine reductase [Candidatus Hydrogenedentes bacterium]|nr:epoxyqueuosine reductase [Candidatus Hydrogenedentota bacterium]